MKLYFKYILIQLKSQMQYRASFLLVSFGQFIMPLSLLFALYFLFERFGNIKGWNFFEVGICFAVIHMAFAISECVVRGFDEFQSLIVKGDFDRLLVRPRGTILQVLGSKFEFSKVGRLIQGVVVLAWAILNLSINWSILKVITLILMIISGVSIFSGFFILTATLCFWTVQGLEIANIFTDGGREMAQYPLNIYKKWVSQIFTYVIPFGSVNYLPLMFILDKTQDNSSIYALYPFMGIVFIIPCLMFWKVGVRHYHSTGS